jgi:flagellar transcriptional activator FlhD
LLAFNKNQGFCVEPVSVFNKEGTMPVTDNSLLNDIQEVNLSYLMLAQRMLRENYAAGMFRLGFDSDVADIVMRLSPAQLVKLAGSSSLICKFRLNDYDLLSSLTQDVLGGVLQQAHSTILLSQKASEQPA